MVMHEYSSRMVTVQKYTQYINEDFVNILSSPPGLVCIVVLWGSYFWLNIHIIKFTVRS